MFDFSTVKGPYQAVMDGRWEDLEEIFDNDERFSLSYPIMTVAEDNAFHIAVHSKSEKPLKQLLERLEDHDQMRTDALHTFNAYENTVIQEAAISNNIAAVKLLVEGGYVTDEQLLKRNKSGQTPLFKAAAFGSTKVVKYLASRPNQMITTSDNKQQLHNNHRTRKDTTSILHAAVQGEHFGTALWLLKRDKGLAKLKTEENGMTSLHLLTNLKTAFTHKFGNHFWHRFLYYCIPTGNDENDDADNIDDNSEDDQHDSDNQNPPPQWKNPLKTINKSFWKYFIGDSRWPIARKIWIKKRKCNFALKLARELIKNDRSWLQSYTQETMASFKSLDDEGPVYNIKIDHDDPRTVPINLLEDNERPITESNESHNLNISLEDKNDSQTSLKEQPDEQLKEIPIKEDNKPVETPLLAATKTGVIKIVKEILKMHPQAVEHVSHKRQNILHVAASYRRREVFDLVKQMQMQTSRLILGIDEDGYSVLHHVADNKNYTGGTSPGPAYQLQKELEWFKSVEEIMPSYFTQHHDKNNKTAKELFKEKHAIQLKEAQQWIKETSQSCSGVAVLVSTVVFAAAFTVPGGTNDDNGLPILIHSPFFMFFTVTDVVSLSCSLTAVVMFLSILTSPFQLHNFRITLPRRLTIGFALLFMSVATTMLAFTSTVILIIRSDQHRQWTLTLMCCAAFVPVSVLALTHFPLFVSFIKAWSYPCSSLLRILTFLGKLVFQRGKLVFQRGFSRILKFLRNLVCQEDHPRLEDERNV